MLDGDYDGYRTHHSSRRLRGFDYTQPAAYLPSVSRFARVITLCTHDRAHLFGTITDGQMHPNAADAVIAEEWRRSEAMRDEIALDAFVVMPNHVHGIAVIVPPGTPDGNATDPHGYRLRGNDGGHDADGDQTHQSATRHARRTSVATQLP